MYAQIKESVVSHLLFRFLISCGMPLWSVEEWRARIGSSWAALGRPVGCSSHCKQRRHYVCCPLSGGGGGMVVSTIPMMTNDYIVDALCVIDHSSPTGGWILSSPS